MKRSLALAAVLGLITMAQAQTTPTHTPPSPATIAQHEVQRYTTLLTLTPAQVEQATTYFTAEATARQNARASERTAHQALEAAIKANDSAECRGCHTARAMAFAKQPAMAADAHSSLATSGMTCIDCHRGVAHTLPPGS